MISVILPTYNRESTIMRAVSSVLNQSYENIELIIVDDCSSDETLCSLNLVRDPRLKVISLKENKGANFCRNIGIANALGDYIAFQDSDDFWFPDKLEKQMTYLLNKNCDIIANDMVVIDETTNNLVQSISNKSPEGKVDFDRLLYENYISTQMILAKKDVFEFEKFNDKLTRFQDWDLFLRLSKKYVFHFSREKLVIQYVQHDSISKNLFRGIEGLKTIDSIYKNELDKNSVALSHHKYILGVWSKHANLNHTKYFYDSLRLNFSWKTLIKFFASLLKIY